MELKQKKIIGLLAIVVVVLALMGYLSWRVFYTPNQKRVPTALELQHTREDALARIIATGDPKNYDKAKGEIIDGVDAETTCRNNIFYTRATTNLDADSCSQLDNKFMDRQDCAREVLLLKVAKTNNSASCDAPNFPQASDYCHQQYAIVQAVKNKDTEQCTAGSTNCWEQVALAKLASDPKNFSCSYFETKQLLDDCQTIKRAISLKNGEGALLCEIIKSDQVVSICRKYFLRK